MPAVKSMPLALRSSESITRSTAIRPRRPVPAPVRVRLTEPAAHFAPEPLPRPSARAPEKLRIVLWPMLGPRDGLDVTQALTRAVAEELWHLHGGNDVMNWLEAERLLGEALGSNERHM